MKRLTLYICAVFLVLGVAASAIEQETEEPTGKLMVVWTSADPDVADKVCLMSLSWRRRFWVCSLTSSRSALVVSKASALWACLVKASFSP